MPRKTEWIHRLDDAIAALEAIPAPIVDASALASLLQITPRHARRILGQFFPQPAGRGFVALRADLITHLRTLTAQPDQQHELARRQRVDQQLEAARRDTKARQVLIQPAPQLPTTILDLPAGLLLEPGRLEIRFQTPAELLTHLLSLARAISDDFERFADLGPVTPSETA